VESTNPEPGSGADPGHARHAPGRADSREAADPLATEDPRVEAALPDVEVEEVLEQLDAIRSERDGHLADLQRITAEFANYRRQSSRRQEEIVEHAASALAEKLLPVLDACESALSQGAVDVGPIQGALLDVLHKEGLEVVAGEATPFDPELHEAVVHEPSEDEGEPVVSRVMRAGYTWRGKVLRPAMVKVRG
jgi:molecular chaperone GrpE